MSPRQVEVNERLLPKEKVIGGHVLVTPPIDEDYWLYRVRLRGDQAMVAFPKFGTIGIGFAQEQDWNTNLPFPCSPEQIYRHIQHNKGDEAITEAECIEAITALREAARRHFHLTDEEWADQQAKVGQL